MKKELMDQIIGEAKALYPKAIEWRRDFHKYAESGWTEFRTAAVIAEKLYGLGFDVLVGDQIFDDATMMGVPDKKILEAHQERAIAEGALPKWVEQMAGGKTGVVGVLKGKGNGPVVAARFDIDANDLVESASEAHKPNIGEFSSIHAGVAHGCGHDGHAAIGLGVAEIIAAHRDQLEGTVKLVFQPAEEGVRGARSMMEAGVVDDVDYFFGAHLGFMVKHDNGFSANAKGFLATSKLDAIFKGAPAHAGAAPQDGRNAILAAAVATTNLHAISRHGEGTTRINVGQIQGGSGRNVLPAEATIKLETRGGDTQLNEYMEKKARQVIQAAADMYECEVEIKAMGGAACAESHPELAKRMTELARETGIFSMIEEECHLGGSEDCAYFMERVNNKGGQAIYMAIGTEIAAGHHEAEFDFNEPALQNGIAIMSLGILDLAGQA